MNRIKLGSECITTNDKSFEYKETTCVIKKGTYVIVCDDDNVEKGHVLVEAEGYDTVFGYEISELIPTNNN